MALKYKISNIVGFKVEGTINDETGAAKPFDFNLTCDRHSTDEIADRMAGDYSFAAVMTFMLSVIKGWSGVRDDADKAMDYSEENFRELCANISGLLFIAFTAYREQAGAKAKN